MNKIPNQQKILIVDDMHENIVAMKTSLKNINAELHTVTSGEKALTLVMDHHFALILLDVLMPGMSGFETAELLRINELTRDIPIIFVTALSEDQKQKFEGHDQGITDYLFKPYEPHVLRNKVKLFLEFDQQKRELYEALADKAEYEMELKEALKEAKQANHLKSEFLANMSHELRSPLNSIILLSEDFSKNREKNLTEKQIKRIKVVHKSGNDLLELINDILDLSKVESGKMDVYISQAFIAELSDSLKSIYKPLAKDKGIEFISNITENMPESIITDQQKLIQILRNLLANAIKFTSQGNVTIDFGRPMPGAAPIILPGFDEPLDHDQIVAFSVSDTGIGIPLACQETIFDAFRQVDGSTSRHYGGTGLGLSISLNFTRLINGVIEMESVPGKGSRFTIYIPEQLESSERAKEEERAKPPNKTAIKSVNYETSHISDAVLETISGKKILLVDDDMRNVFTLSGILEDHDIVVFKAVNGRQALDLLKVESDIDLVLMDIMMPEMNGYEAIKRIRKQEKYKNLPIIAVTAKAMEGDSEKCIKAGADQYISKPINLTELFSSMERQL
ncbi:MAG: response regulator [Desulfobacterales bacterium]|nr:response regulator [Desulfobacterales bacterium]